MLSKVEIIMKSQVQNESLLALAVNIRLPCVYHIHMKGLSYSLPTLLKQPTSASPVTHGSRGHWTRAMK